MLKDPIKHTFDVRWGDLGTTNVFFLISGYLIAQTLIKNDDIFSFIKNRLVRLVPAILVANVVIVLLCFLCVKVNFSDYIFSKDVFYFIYRNSILFFDIRSRIGFDIFSTNIVPSVTNPQWWTLPWNLKMYASAILLFGTSKLLKSTLYSNLIYISTVAVCMLPLFEQSWWSVILPHFFTGYIFYLNRKNIPLHWSFFFISISVYIVFYNTVLIHVLSPVLLTYMILYLASISARPLKRVNSMADLSLGIFLYHMLIQQFLIYYGLTNVYAVFALSLFISAIFSFLSLKFIEIPFQKLGRKEWELTRSLKRFIIRS
jgi:peptidoglycan/LPS O-acetylase OafA/YrhL